MGDRIIWTALGIAVLAFAILLEFKSSPTLVPRSSAAPGVLTVTRRQPTSVRAVPSPLLRTGHDVIPRLKQLPRVPASSQELLDLPRSELVTLNAQPRRVLAARAVLQSFYTPSMGPVLARQKGFVIVARTIDSEQDWTDLVMRDADKPVLLNAAGGRPEVVTGTLIVELKEGGHAEQVAARQGLFLQHFEEGPRLAYLRVPDGYRLRPGVARLASDRDVQTVEIEILRGRWQLR